MIIGFGLTSFYLINSGLYPVAFVNFHTISAKTLEKDYDAALRYFHNALLTYGSDPSILEQKDSKKEIKRAALNKLITDRLIYKEVKKRLGRDLNNITEKIISQNVDSSKLEQAVKEIYGLRLDEFKKQVLVAQAHREILEGRMFMNDENFDEWLKNIIGSAKVIILLPELYWDGEKVTARE